MESKKANNIGSMAELAMLAASGDTPRSCESCKYRAQNRTCNYCGITKHTRLGKIAEKLGTSQGAEWEWAIRVENCTFWEPRKKGTQRKQIKPIAPSVKYDAETGKYYKRLIPSKARELIKAGYGNKQIVAMEGWSPKDVAEFRLMTEPKQDTTDCLRKRPVRFDHDRAFDLYAVGKSDCEIASILGCQTKSIQAWRSREGLPIEYSGQERPVKRARAQKAALTADQEERASKLWEAGCSDSKIGRALGIPESRVRRWRAKNDIPSVRKKGRDNANG